jgi:uncharacterized protein YggE
MKLRIMCGLGIFLLAGAASAQVINGAPYVAVHGEARREVVPDLFPLKLTLSETSKDTAATQAKIERLATEILAIADRLKVEGVDLSVQNLSISPRYDYDDKADEQVFLGNTYEREIRVRFHTLARMREFIAGLPEDKALKIDTGTFETSHAQDLRRELLHDAIADARATAEALAAGADRKLGPVHTISNRAFNVSYSGDDGGGATTLGSVTVTGTALSAPGVVVLREGRVTLHQDVYIIYTLE